MTIQSRDESFSIKGIPVVPAIEESQQPGSAKAQKEEKSKPIQQQTVSQSRYIWKYYEGGLHQFVEFEGRSMVQLDGIYDRILSVCEGL